MRITCGKLDDLTQNVEWPPGSGGHTGVSPPGSGPLYGTTGGMAAGIIAGSTATSAASTVPSVRVPFASVAFQPAVPHMPRKYYRFLTAGSSSVSLWALEILPPSPPVTQLHVSATSEAGGIFGGNQNTMASSEVTQPESTTGGDTGESATYQREENVSGQQQHRSHRWLHAFGSNSRIRSYRLQRMRDHVPSYVLRVAWSPDGTRWGSADSNQIILWYLKSPGGIDAGGPEGGSGGVKTTGPASSPAGLHRHVEPSQGTQATGECWARYKTLVEPAVSEIFDFCWVSPTRIAIGGMENVVIKDVGGFPPAREKSENPPLGGVGAPGAFGATATFSGGVTPTISIQLADFAICKGLSCRPRWVALEEQDEDEGRPNRPPNDWPTDPEELFTQRMAKPEKTNFSSSNSIGSINNRGQISTRSPIKGSIGKPRQLDDYPCYLAVATNVKKGFVYEIRGNRAEVVMADWTLFIDGPMDTPLIRHCGLDPLGNIAAFSFGERRGQTFGAVYDLQEVFRATSQLHQRGEQNPFQALYKMERQFTEEKRILGAKKVGSSTVAVNANGGSVTGVDSTISMADGNPETSVVIGETGGNGVDESMGPEADQALLLFKDARFRVRGHQMRVSAVAFGNGVYQWEPNLDEILPKANSQFSSLPDRGASWNQIRSRLLSSLELRSKLFDHPEWPHFSRYAQCSVDGSLSIWNIVQPTTDGALTGVCLTALPPTIVDQTGLITDMSWSWDDKILAVASDDGKMTIFIIEEEDNDIEEQDRSMGEEKALIELEEIRGEITPNQAERREGRNLRVAFSYQQWLSTTNIEAQDPVLPSPNLLTIPAQSPLGTDGGEKEEQPVEPSTMATIATGVVVNASDTTLALVPTTGVVVNTDSYLANQVITNVRDSIPQCLPIITTTSSSIHCGNNEYNAAAFYSGGQGVSKWPQIEGSHYCHQHTVLSNDLSRDITANGRDDVIFVSDQPQPAHNLDSSISGGGEDPMSDGDGGTHSPVVLITPQTDVIMMSAMPPMSGIGGATTRSGQ